MSFSPIPGAIVPVSAELYGTSRVAGGRSGSCLGGGRRGGLAGGGAAGSAPGAGTGSGGSGVGGGAGGAGGRVRPPRSAGFFSVFCLFFLDCSVTCLHPKGGGAHSPQHPRRVRRL